MMGFLAPWFLAALVAVGLPVYIHLLRRQTTTPRPVSSLMFFERGIQSSTRHRRLRYLLLFALRALLMILLALVFAKPFVRRSAASANDRLMLIAVDNSFSMRAGTRLADAKREALEVLATRRPSQRVQVMALGGELQVLTQPIQDAGALRAAVENIQPSDSHGNFGELGRGMRALAETVHTPVDLHLFSDMQVLTQPIQDAGALRAAVENIQPGDSHGDFGELGRGMRALAETVHTPVDLHLFSDMQASNMPVNFADMVMPGNVSLVLHSVATAAVPNWTVESVEAPGLLVDPKKARVLAVIAGHQTPAATRTVSLVINGAVTAMKKVDVPADGRATIAFESLDVPYGASRCEVRIDAADGFAADDASAFAVKRADPERVLFVHQAGDSRSQLYFGAALGAAAQASFVLQPIVADQAADVDPTKYAFVVLSDVSSIPSILENSLLQYVRNGGSVLIAAGTAEGHRQKIPVFGESASDARYYSRSGGFSTVAQVDASHPAMKDAAGWTDAKFYYATIVDAGHSRVVARLADGVPLVMDKQMGQGHVLLFASGFDNVTNDLPLNPAFVPFVDESARYLAGVERLSGARVVDSFVPLRSVTNEGGGTGTTVEVIGPDGKRPLSLQEEATAQSFQLTHAGFYHIRFANGRDALIAVNPDRRESGLDLIPQDVLKLWSGSAGSDAGSAQHANAAATAEKKGAYSLWWWIMLLILIAAVAESVLASRYLGTQREEA